MTVAEFRQTVERFIKDHDLTPTEFGKQYASDPGFVFALRDGREPRESTRDNILARLPAEQTQGASNG